MARSKEVKKTILFPREDVQRFEEIHPGHGAFTWFLRAALRNYNALHEGNANDLVSVAVRDIQISV